MGTEDIFLKLAIGEADFPDQNHPYCRACVAVMGAIYQPSESRTQKGFVVLAREYLMTFKVRASFAIDMALENPEPDNEMIDEIKELIDDVDYVDKAKFLKLAKEDWKNRMEYCY